MVYGYKYNVRSKKILSILFLLTILQIGAQNDTIYLSDTIISSVRIVNQDENNLRYFYIDSNTKKTAFIPVEEIESIIYENDKIEVFCDLISRKKFLGTDESIIINYGDRENLWFDQKIYTLLSKDLKTYNSIIDALNYMGSEGWKTINSYSTSRESYTIEHYILKKEISK